MTLLSQQHGCSLEAADSFIGHDAFHNLIPTA